MVSLNLIGSMNYTVITENDESAWGDVTGTLYHFPKRYLKHLRSGTSVVYYKGKMRNPAFAKKRLSQDPHYFGAAKIGKVYKDTESKKEDYYAEIVDYRRFKKPVPIRDGVSTFEEIPANREFNYWRDGVRQITRSIYAAIVSVGGIAKSRMPPDKEESKKRSDARQGLPEALESFLEGGKTTRFVSTYERDPRLRRLAIKLHGLKCAVCLFDFGRTYGPHGEGFIHVHHLRPVSGLGGKKEVNPKSDMAVLCANCHSMVHRYKDKTLSLDQLKEIMLASRKMKSPI